MQFSRTIPKYRGQNGSRASSALLVITFRLPKNRLKSWIIPLKYADHTHMAYGGLREEFMTEGSSEGVDR